MAISHDESNGTPLNFLDFKLGEQIHCVTSSVPPTVSTRSAATQITPKFEELNRRAAIEDHRYRNAFRRRIRGSENFLSLNRGLKVESHTVAKKDLLSPRAVDDRTLFSYDEHGNLTDMIATGAEGSLIRRTTNAFVYDSHGDWFEKTEVELNNTWKTEPFPAAFETIHRFKRTISYFPES
jgi:hypothetical protein